MIYKDKVTNSTNQFNFNKTLSIRTIDGNKEIEENREGSIEQDLAMEECRQTQM
jgi:hypothetical protein